MTPLGTAIKAARLAAGLDVRTAASLLALSQSAGYNLECGSWHPGRARLDGLAAAYGVTGEALDALRKLRAPDGDVTFGWSALQRRNTELAHLRKTDTSRSTLTAFPVIVGCFFIIFTNHVWRNICSVTGNLTAIGQTTRIPVCLLARL